MKDFIKFAVILGISYFLVYNGKYAIGSDDWFGAMFLALFMLGGYLFIYIANAFTVISDIVVEIKYNQDHR